MWYYSHFLGFLRKFGIFLKIILVFVEFFLKTFIKFSQNYQIVEFFTRSILKFLPRISSIYPTFKHHIFTLKNFFFYDSFERKIIEIRASHATLSTISWSNSEIDYARYDVAHTWKWDFIQYSNWVLMPRGLIHFICQKWLRLFLCMFKLISASESFLFCLFLWIHTYKMGFFLRQGKGTFYDGIIGFYKNGIFAEIF